MNVHLHLDSLSTGAVNGTNLERADEAKASVNNLQWPCMACPSFHIETEIISSSVTFDGRSGQTVMSSSMTNLHRYEIVLKAKYKIKLYLAA